VAAGWLAGWLVAMPLGLAGRLPQGLDWTDWAGPGRPAQRRRWQRCNRVGLWGQSFSQTVSVVGLSGESQSAVAVVCSAAVPRCTVLRCTVLCCAVLWLVTPSLISPTHPLTHSPTQ